MKDLRDHAQPLVEGFTEALADPQRHFWCPDDWEKPSEECLHCNQLLDAHPMGKVE